MKKEDKKITLPKTKKRRLIDKKEFLKLAKKVKESFEEEAKFLHEKKVKDGNRYSSHTYCFS